MNKVSAAERDNDTIMIETHLKRIKKSIAEKKAEHLAQKIDADNKLVNEIFAKLKFGDQKLVKFEIPRGYTAKDVYWLGLWWVDYKHEIPKKYNNIIKVSQLREIIVTEVEFEQCSNKDCANFYLLLAYANGFKD